jgi:hypothetical protein
VRLELGILPTRSQPSYVPLHLNNLLAVRSGEQLQVSKFAQQSCEQGWRGSMDVLMALRSPLIDIHKYHQLWIIPQISPIILLSSVRLL